MYDVSVMPRSGPCKATRSLGPMERAAFTASAIGPALPLQRCPLCLCREPAFLGPCLADGARCVPLLLWRQACALASSLLLPWRTPLSIFTGFLAPQVRRSRRPRCWRVGQPWVASRHGFSSPSGVSC